jgi:hypothetical protein
MRVKVWVEAEAEADVALGDVLAELSLLPDNERPSSILATINAAHGILYRISDAHISEMSNEQRNIIGFALRRQSERYLPPNG